MIEIEKKLKLLVKPYFLFSIQFMIYSTWIKLFPQEGIKFKSHGSHTQIKSFFVDDDDDNEAEGLCDSEKSETLTKQAGLVLLLSTSCSFS